MLKRILPIVLAIIIASAFLGQAQTVAAAILRGNQSHALGGGPVGGGPFNSISWSHTLGASSNFLVIGIYESNFGGPPVPITSVMYGSQPMTLAVSANNTFIYSLVNPASGTNTITITLSATASEFGTVAQDYSGVDTISPIDVTAGQATDTASITLTLTTNKDKDWSFLFVRDGTGTEVPGTNSTLIFQSNTGNPPNLGFGAYDNQAHGDITPAGSFSMTATNNGTVSVHGVMIAFSPTPIAEGNLWQKRSFEGKGFIVTTNEITITPAAETNFVLIRNPAASGKLHRTNELVITLRTEGQNSRVRIYKNPTITTNGNLLTINNVRTSGNLPVTQMFSMPTTSSSGQLIAAYSRNADSLDRPFDLSLYLEPGESFLITVQGTATGNDYILTYTLAEE